MYKRIALLLTSAFQFWGDVNRFASVLTVRVGKFAERHYNAQHKTMLTSKDDHPLRKLKLVVRHSVILTTLLIAACAAPGPNSTGVPPAPSPTVTRPPLWTAEVSATQVDATPLPTRTLTPPVTPGPYEVVVAQNNAFSIQVPSNWEISEGTYEVTGRSVYKVKYFSAVGPGDAPQPGVIIFYEWPSSIAVINDNAWESAYALTALVVKTCGMRLQPELLPVDFGDEAVFGREYIDSCGLFGLLTGAVHHDINYGALFEAPVPYYNEWRPVLYDMLISLTFGR